MTTTVAPAIPPVHAALEPDRPKRRARIDREQLRLTAACAVSAFALVWVVYYRLTPASGAFGFAVCWYLAFIATTWLVVREREGQLAATDRAMTLAIGTVSVVLITALAFILGEVVVKGIPSLRPHFFTKTMSGVGPLSKATEGGAFHSIVGTLEQVGLATLISVPLGVLTAVYLNEIGGRFTRPVRMFVDAMSGVPSIVCGLFIYALWVLRFGFSGFAAALALSILMLPTITRTSAEVLRLVPDGLREASLAAGASEWRTTWSVVLPTARSGLVTAVLLGVARAVGDTAALIATAAGFDSMNWNPFHGQQDSLPLFVYKQIRIGLIPAQTARAWTGALVLVTLVLLIFAAARFASRPPRARRRRDVAPVPIEVTE
ncbi:MAG: phosphate transport system permease protein [Actinomycetota bacterium]|nr:phosphate transport system permease protein [Actinomycetota bacterium]